MYTRCTHCDTWLKVSADQLRTGFGQVRCGACADVFNALLHLTDLEPTLQAPDELPTLEQVAPPRAQLESADAEPADTPAGKAAEAASEQPALESPREHGIRRPAFAAVPMQSVAPEDWMRAPVEDQPARELAAGPLPDDESVDHADAEVGAPNPVPVTKDLPASSAAPDETEDERAAVEPNGVAPAEIDAPDADAVAAALADVSAVDSAHFGDADYGDAGVPAPGSDDIRSADADSAETDALTADPHGVDRGERVAPDDDPAVDVSGDGPYANATERSDTETPGSVTPGTDAAKPEAPWDAAPASPSTSAEEFVVDAITDEPTLPDVVRPDVGTGSALAATETAAAEEHDDLSASPEVASDFANPGVTVGGGDELEAPVFDRPLFADPDARPIRDPVEEAVANLREPIVPGEPLVADIPPALRADYARLATRRQHPVVRVLLVVFALAGLIGLPAQYAWFMPEDLVRRYPLAEPYIERFCATTGCTFEQRDDRRFIELVGRDVRVHPKYEGALQVQAAFTNAGPRAQRYPEVRFTLFNVNGDVIGARSFKPEDYLPNPGMAARRLQPGETTQIQLDLIAPEDTAVSFEFEFI